MQAVHIHKTRADHVSKPGKMPSGWWIAPASIASLALWVMIFKALF